MSRQKYVFSPAADAQIREIYLNEVGIIGCAYAGPVKALAAQFGMPRWRVSRRACELGLLPVKKKEPPWSDEELAILENNAHRTPAIVQKYLKRKGYARSVQGIMVKRKRLNISRTCMDGYTARSLAECFGIDSHAITRWIEQGWLKAMHRGTHRTPQQGGDEWFIRDKAVRDFVIENISRIDFRKVDKYWLVDLLTGEMT